MKTIARERNVYRFAERIVAALAIKWNCKYAQCTIHISERKMKKKTIELNFKL